MYILGSTALLFSCNPDPFYTLSTTYQQSPYALAENKEPFKDLTEQSDHLTYANEHSTHREKIIGDNDLTPVSENGANLPEELRPLLGAFGQISVGCSATHIGEGLVLTAGHCIMTSPRTGPKVCRGSAVAWGNYAGQKSQTISKCREIVFRTYRAASDIALIRVDNPPVAAIPLDLKTSSSSILLPRTHVTMLSFPRMRPLEWSMACELSEYKTPSGVNPADAPFKGVKKFLHSCDTEPGSSGAALIDLNSLKIIGVHGGSSDELNYGTFLDDLQFNANEK